MNKIGIIVAMQEELEEILNIMTEKNKKSIYNVEYIEGKISDKNIVIVKSGVGKVNAARVTQMLIDIMKVDTIINVGSAGAINPKLNIGDIVIADKLVQHDFDITAFNHKKGYITGVGDYIYCTEKLINEFSKIINDIKSEEYNIKIGTIASGDIFCTDSNMKQTIYSEFDADCVEMEGAAVAQVCYLDNIPFIVIRSISDSPNGNNAIDFKEFVSLASKKCAYILRKFFGKA